MSGGRWSFRDILKRLVVELSGWRIIRSENCLVREMSAGDLSVRELSGQVSDRSGCHGYHVWQGPKYACGRDLAPGLQEWKRRSGTKKRFIERKLRLTIPQIVMLKIHFIHKRQSKYYKQWIFFVCCFSVVDLLHLLQSFRKRKKEIEKSSPRLNITNFNSLFQGSKYYKSLQVDVAEDVICIMLIYSKLWKLLISSQ